MAAEIDDVSDKKKSHRERNAGRKAEKKKSKKEAANPVLDENDKQKRNPKAFAFNSAVRAERRFRRKQDIETKKQHIPVVDRTPVEPPPILIAVVGPPKVGKSTVINNLIKLFTKSPLTDIKGPVTIVTGKKRRITLIECNNDINAMIDIAKVADLVLLLCDASFGFEMEIFEFLNICQVHGMPRIMGILTHLDMIKNNKTLKNTKKILKHRFWTEVYAGAKLFYLSGILHGEYLRNEIKNLGRFISVIKFRPLTWRSTHSYLLGDRIEDLTSQEFIRQNPKCDRTISLYGYVRGVPLIKNTSVHIAGLGDLKIADISYLPDPCPLPEAIKKRSLIEKEKFIYAPFSGVGGIVYDKDAVYVELGGSHSHKEHTDMDSESKSLVSNLVDTKQTLDIKMLHSEMQLFTGGKKIISKDVSDHSIKISSSKFPVNNYQNDGVDSDLDEELNELRKHDNLLEETVKVEDNRIRRKVIFEQADEDFINAINTCSGEESDSGEETDFAEEYDNKPQKPMEYTVLKENKDKEVHNIVSGALKYLDSKKSYKSSSSCSSEISDEDSNEDYDDISLATNESLIGITKMKKKKKEKLIDVDDIQLPLKRKPENDKKYIQKQVFMKEIKTTEKDGIKLNFKKNEIDSESSDEPSRHDNSLNKKEKLDRIHLDLEDSENEDMEGLSFDEKDDQDADIELEVSEDETELKSSNRSDKISSEDIEHDGRQPREKKEAKRFKEHSEEEQTDSDDSEEDMGLKWKENLAKKARDAFLDRQKTTQNIMKLVYGVFDKHGFKIEEQTEDIDDKDQEEIGGLFHLVTHEQKRLKEEKERLNVMETSLFNTWNVPTRNWLEEENKSLIVNCFVTGQWKQSEDAQELLRLDDMEDLNDASSEVYGDFEDLETGEKHTAKSEINENKKRKRDNGEDVTLDREELAEKKRQLKEKFDAEYDNGEKATYYDDLKTSAEKQAQLNKSVFENMADDLRVQIEGYRPGMYVRIEFENVSSEFITNFDPTYPLIIGALNLGEENIGFVNVKIKKHRWYKKILKTNDPVIISLGWRRFQTIPLFSKLEDDMKYRYLKYTPEHVQCNAHFWGPITPQGTGFLALQSCEGSLDFIKQQGFRIIATGSVQELEKSTQIMKKLKLIGYPMKIYKKTAFIKDMFNSALEVAKFEGARIKTVSGVRGQIKKAVNKPEGCFRATFEDKIMLSDIVFCRTWYKVNVPKFYCPVTTLLLPGDKKMAWKGVRTTGEVKRAKGIKNTPNNDSLYTEIVRQPKVFKPLSIPRKLQKELPYRDRPKFGPLSYDKKPDIEKKRVAVVREPHEQKVANMLKMLKASYEHKQEQLKKAMSERVSQHKAMMEGQEVKKLQREKAKRKDIFRAKSKAQIREEKKTGKK